MILTEKIKFVFYHKLIRQLIKFGIAGSLNTGIDFTIYFYLTRQIGWFADRYLLANAIAFLTANIFSFFVNKYWTFKAWQGGRIKQYIKFFTVSVVALLAVEASMYILVSYFGIFDVIAKFITLLVSITINFLGYKFWAFK